MRVIYQGLNQWIKDAIHNTVMGFVSKVMVMLNCSPLAITIVNVVF